MWYGIVYPGNRYNQRFFTSYLVLLIWYKDFQGIAIRFIITRKIIVHQLFC
jgi:hypothetical protein